MKETPISVTLAARKFADCINRVRYQGMSFLLEKNGIPVARLIPVQPNLASDLEQLASTLRQVRRGPLPDLADDEKEPLRTEQRAEDKNANQPEEPSKHPRRPTLNW